MNRRHPIAVAALAAVLAGCSPIEAILQPAATSGTASFATYVALGSGLSAGFQSGGLVDRHQIYAFPALFAQQTGKTVAIAGTGAFSQPTVNFDGIPALLRIQSLSPLVISNAGRTTGTPTNFGQPSAYHDLGIPTGLLVDCADTTHYYQTQPPVNRTNFTYFNLIARSRGSLLAQAVGLAPTFVSVEYGFTEIAAALSVGSGAALPAASYGALLTGTLNGLQALAPAADVVLCTVPDLTATPFVNTFSPIALDTTGAPSPLIGTGGPLGPTDRVLLSAGSLLAGGTGFATNTRSYVSGVIGNGNPLPDAVVLTAAERAALQTAQAGYNAALATEASARGFALADFAAAFAVWAGAGIEFQGSTINADFVTGGAFSLDGIHPTDLGHGLLANAMIDAVNATYGASVPPVNLARVATNTSSALRPAREERASAPHIVDAERLYRDMFPWRPGVALP